MAENVQSPVRSRIKYVQSTHKNVVKTSTLVLVLIQDIILIKFLL